MNQQTHTATLHAWLSPYHSIEGLFDQPSKGVVSALTYSVEAPGGGGFCEREGYTYMGTAEVTVAIGSRTEIVMSKVQGLKAQQQLILANAQAQATRIEGQIQKLLAISYDSEVAA